ncbi:hypothetical protein [Enterococcus mundtii]|uniref:Uncharacterized protein n=1 Tax=Enterococcus mundtii TaxID=53346 RepID=A0A1V2UEV2_ENTMU|nr:hypothetical protein [Enterococcus mundtii]ONN41856.1 hypothetical protein BTN92_11910 [Enterococcus mundtii]
MKQYLDQWKVIEGSLKEERIKQLPDCLEKEHLLQVREMLRNEQFDPDQFLVIEYPATGVYCCNDVNGEKYFIIQEYEETLLPYYTTLEMNEKGINHFPCTSIKTSMELTEC